MHDAILSCDLSTAISSIAEGDCGGYILVGPTQAMKISVDDWHFRNDAADLIVLDVFLDNGQHAVMEVNVMKDRSVPNGDVPEIIVFCELPGERVAESGCTARWVSRPPSRECPWSGVQLPAALLDQIRARSGPRGVVSG
jgi:hypothetical protein